MKDGVRMTKEEYLNAARELDYTDWRIQEDLKNAEDVEKETGIPFVGYGLFILELPDINLSMPKNREDFEACLRDLGRYGKKSIYLSLKKEYEEEFGIEYNLEKDIALHPDTTDDDEEEDEE